MIEETLLKQIKKPHSQYTALHETPIWEAKMPLIFSSERDAYSIFIINRLKSTVLGTQVFYFITWRHLHWAAKMANYFQNYQDSLGASALLKRSNLLRNTDVTKINFRCLKNLFACLTWPQPTTSSSVGPATLTAWPSIQPNSWPTGAGNSVAPKETWAWLAQHTLCWL